MGIARAITRWKRKEIEAAFAKNYRLYRDNYIDIRIAPRQKDFARILIITPRSIGTAPERNLLKRRLRAIFYQNSLYKSHYDWLVLAKPKSPTISYTTLQELINNLVNKLK